MLSLHIFLLFILHVLLEYLLEILINFCFVVLQFVACLLCLHSLFDVVQFYVGLMERSALGRDFLRNAQLIFIEKFVAGQFSECGQVPVTVYLCHCVAFKVALYLACVDSTHVFICDGHAVSEVGLVFLKVLEIGGVGIVIISIFNEDHATDLVDIVVCFRTVV